MSSTKFNLLVVAHPDDEAIFFAGLIQRERKLPWMVICVTDANADGQGALRKRQFGRSMKQLKVRSWQWWGFPDRFEKRLPVDEIADRLSQLPTPHAVYTHGVIGEYMHPHHQDICASVHRAFVGHPRIYVSAYNAFPEIRIHLTKKEYALKTRLLTKTYGSETSRFLNILPATSSEGFVQVAPEEVAILYAFFKGGSRAKLQASKLKTYAWLADYLKTRPMKKRLF